MALHKRKIIRLLLLTLILFTIFNSLQITNVQAQTTFTYTFDESVLYDKINPSPDIIQNVRNQTHFTDIYNGTYSFTDDDIGATGTDISLISTDNSDIDCQVIINELIEGYSKVLEFDDGSNEGRVSIFADFTPSAFGTIEYWFYTENTQKEINLRLIEDGSHQGIVLNIDGGDLQYYDSGFQKLADLIDDTWYHIEIEFDSTAGGYQGLATDTYRVFLNGKEYGDYDYYQVGDVIQQFYIYSFIPDTLYSVYMDAFSLSWDADYDINDNIIPYNYVNETLEIDNWGFYNNENGTPTEPMQENIPFWDELATLGFIMNDDDFDQWQDDTVVHFDWGTADHEGLERSIDVNYGNIIEIVFNMSLSYSPLQKAYLLFDIDSYDDTLIIRLRIDSDTDIGDLVLSYWDGADYVVLEDLDEGWIRLLTLNITIVSEIIVLNTNEGTYTLPKLVEGKSGIGDIKIEGYTGGAGSHTLILQLDSIGIYIDGVSISNDYSNSLYKTEKNFDPQDYNLLNLNATGFFGLSVVSLTNDSEKFPYFGYSNASNTVKMNVYDIAHSTLDQAYISITTNTTYSLNSISITGVMLTHGSNEYIPSYSNSGIDDNINYFYVDSSNRLRFSLTVNDNDTEHIEINFNIPDLQTENYSVSFLSNMDGSSFGFLRIMFTDDTSSFVPFPTYLTTTNIIIPQTREIESLSILITDNDKYDNDYAYGYITELRLLAYRDMGVSIITLNLMMVIVPIMVLLVPTFGISARYGKNTILPVFILMSIICFATSLIPLWVFFVIMLSAGAFLFMKRKRGDN